MKPKQPWEIWFKVIDKKTKRVVRDASGHYTYGCDSQREATYLVKVLNNLPIDK